MQRKNKRIVFLALLGVSASFLFLAPKLTKTTSAVHVVSATHYLPDTNLKELRFPISYEKIVSFIEKSSTLQENYQRFFENEKLLTDIVPYYNGTYMDYLATLKFNGIHVNIFWDDLGMAGFYDTAIPNELNVKASHQRNLSTLLHEYVHLTQFINPDNHLAYIHESLAEIIKYEYYGFEIRGYYGAVRNTRILMEIIGSTPLWKYTYQNDDTELLEIINKYLNEEDAKVLIKCLQATPATYANETDKEVMALLEKLYENMYGADLSSNMYIQSILEGKLYDRYYLNSDLITSNQPYYYVENEVKDIEVFYFFKFVSYEDEEYTRLKERASNSCFAIDMHETFVSKEAEETCRNLGISDKEAYNLGLRRVEYIEKAFNLNEESINLLTEQGFSVEKSHYTYYDIINDSFLYSHYSPLLEDFKHYLPNLYEQGFERIQNSLEGAKLQLEKEERCNKKF